MYWCFTLEPILSNRIAEPVGVVVVTIYSELGKSEINALKRGIDALTSPTDTACTQITGKSPEGFELVKPRRSFHLYR
jgi:hypothetical protein